MAVRVEYSRPPRASRRSRGLTHHSNTKAQSRATKATGFSLERPGALCARSLGGVGCPPRGRSIPPHAIRRGVGGTASGTALTAPPALSLGTVAVVVVVCEAEVLRVRDVCRDAGVYAMRFS